MDECEALERLDMPSCSDVLILPGPAFRTFPMAAFRKLASYCQSLLAPPLFLGLLGMSLDARE